MVENKKITYASFNIFHENKLPATYSFTYVKTQQAAPKIIQKTTEETCSGLTLSNDK